MNKWLSLRFEDEKRRRAKEGEEEEGGRAERKWLPVKQEEKKEPNLPATLAKMRGNFDKIITFHLPLL